MLVRRTVRSSGSTPCVASWSTAAHPAWSASSIRNSRRMDRSVAALLATPRDAESAQEDRPVGPTGPAAGTATVQVTPLVLTAVPYPHQAAEPVFIRKQVLPIAFQSVTVNGAFDESSSATAAALRGHAGMARANGGNWEGGTTGGSERKSGSLRRLFLPHN